MATPTSGKAAGGNAQTLWIVIAVALGLAGVGGFFAMREAPQEAAAPAPAPDAPSADNAASAPAPAPAVAAAPEAAPASESPAVADATVPADAQSAPADAAAPAEQADSAATDSTAPATDQSAAPAASNAAPVADQAAATAEETAPSLDLVRVDAEGRAVIAGQAEPGARVTLRLDGQEIDSVTADRAGNFVAMMRIDPSDRPRVLSLEAVGASGAPIAGDETAMIAPFAGPAPEAAPAETVTAQAAAAATDTAQAAAPAAATATETAAAAATETAAAAATETAAAATTETATQPAPAEAAAPAIVVAGSDGVRVLQSGESAAPETAAQTSVQLDAITYDENGAITLAGRGPAADQIRLSLDGQVVETASMDATGQWSVALPEAVASGTYALRIEHVDAAGQVVASLETPFLREDPARIRENRMMAEPGSSVITVQRGFTLWGIAEANFGSGFLYVQIFQQNQGEIRDPDLIYPGQIFALPDLPRVSREP